MERRRKESRSKRNGDGFILEVGGGPLSSEAISEVPYPKRQPPFPDAVSPTTI